MARGNAPMVAQVQRRRLGERLRRSLFAIPALLATAGAVMAVGLLAVDRTFPAADLPADLRMSAESARALLSTISGATITTVGVVFSVTVVAVQLSSGQFSPRVTRGWFRDRGAQATVGLLVATFIYCVLVLREVPGTGGPPRDVPVASALGAVVLAVASVVAVIAFLDHVAQSLYVGEIARRVADETIGLLDAVADRSGDRAAERTQEGRVPGEDDAPRHVVRAGTDGWVQQITGDGVLAAVPPGTVIRLETRPGAFVTSGAPLATLWPTPPDTARAERELRRAVVVGAWRTMQQDIDFGLRQLVDIGLRALSPALNDPTTAVEVVLRISAVLRRLLVCDLTPRRQEGDHGRLLLRPHELDHDRYVAHGYDQLRRAAVGYPEVLTAIVRSLRMLLDAVEQHQRPDRARPLHRQLHLVLAEADKAGLGADDLTELRAAARPAVP